MCNCAVCGLSSVHASEAAVHALSLKLSEEFRTNDSLTKKRKSQ